MSEPTISPVAYASAGTLTESDPGQRSQAMIAHLLGIISIIGPGIYYLVKKNDPTFGPFPRSQVKEVFNFNVAVFLLSLAVQIVAAIIVGVTKSAILGTLFGLVVLVIGIGALVLVILAALKANKGVGTSYPIKLPLLK